MTIAIDTVQLDQLYAGKVIVIKITGQLEAEDYDVFVPAVESHIERHGKIRLLVDLVEFEGWSLSAAWEDTKFGLRHFNDIERLALVGNTRFKAGMAMFCKAFTTAEVRYFDETDAQAALVWTLEGLLP